MRSYRWHKSVALVAAGMVSACGGGGDGGGGSDTAGGAAPEAAVQIDPATVGTISGMVNFAGEAPAMTPVDMSGEPDCAAGYGGDGPMSNTVLASGGGLANVFVYLSEGVSGGPAASGSVPLNQENCRYEPHVFGVQSGQDIAITNSDNFLHNINASPTENRGFNISQPRAGITSTQSFSVAEVMVPIRCDVHGWMNAYVGVVDHPYFAASDATGNFSIGNVPAGTYTVTAWHEEYGTMTTSVTVTAQSTAEIAFDYSADMAGAEVPMNEPLVLHHESDGIHRVSLNGAAGR